MFTNLTWPVPAGKRTILLGPNGAGKSTLLKLLSGYLRPTAGAVSRTNAAGDRGSVGWMPQDITAVRGLTVREQVAYGGWLAGHTRRDSWRAAEKLVAAVRLSDKINDRTTTLSGGQLRRVGLAEALAVDADVLLLDEPTAGLDPAQRHNFKQILGSLPTRGGVVVSTHQIADLDDVFDHVTVLAAGAILFDGSAHEFRAIGSRMGLAEGSLEPIFSELVRGGLH